MSETAIILGPRDFDRLMLSLREQVTSEFAQLKGIVVERPIGTKEAAEYLQIHVDTLYKKIKKGNIPFHEDGGNRYFFPSELNAYIKSKKR